MVNDQIKDAIVKVVGAANTPKTEKPKRKVTSSLQRVMKANHKAFELLADR